MNFLIKLSTVFTALLFAVPLKAQSTIDLETGVAFQSDNQVRIPNEQGATELALSENNLSVFYTDYF